ncbi:MAG: division/cell wall cluster transcriptional repressor MraZ [Gammaproteobacteria bacterium]|nr:division/cell wall cluster transcriptional repressor MraZ [Gammaproteobacteria bacterium]MDH5691536.1 division/cell wall cluster transcriptional repressor MraZ [Gammaproteobacteria bacterium]
MFRGVSALNLDGKGRMVMPTKYRQALDDICNRQLVATIDRERCLLLYPLPEWERIEKELIKLSGFDPRLRSLQRALVGHATDLEMDSNGRLLLPTPLRTYARMEKKIVLVGQGLKFELWDEDRWNEQTEQWIDSKGDNEIPDELRALSL